MIEDGNYKMQLFNLNKWDLIRAKREAMLKTLKELQTRHQSKRMMSIHLVLNKVMRKSFRDFVELKEHKEREKRRLFSTLLITMIFRAKMKMRGGSAEERARRKVRLCLQFGNLSLIDNCKQKAMEVVGHFMHQSADRYQKFSCMRTFSSRIILV